MLYKDRNRLLIAVIVLIFILSGCTEKKTPTEKMVDVLEAVVTKEKVFEDQQDPLVTLEKQEKEKYDQIIQLGMKKYDQIAKLSDEAIILADKRTELFEKETKSLKESEKEFNKAAKIKSELDDPALEKITNDLVEIMMNRYQAHEELYTEYTDAIRYDKELYGMLKNKDLPYDQLEEQINKLNETYKKVLEANEKFNIFTEQYNDKKLSFYQKAGLKSK